MFDVDIKWVTLRMPNYKYFILLSNYGDVLKNGQTDIRKLSPQGYYRASFFGKRWYVHRLVAKYFLNGYDEDLEINHIDLNKLNNNVSNLELIEHKDNCLHAGKNNMLSHGGKNKPVIGINLNKHELKIFPSRKEASVYVGGDEGGNCVSQCVLSRYKTYKDWAFCSLSDSEGFELIEQIKDIFKNDITYK